MVKFERTKEGKEQNPMWQVEKPTASGQVLFFSSPHKFC
jgi:hypothetical protein